MSAAMTEVKDPEGTGHELLLAWAPYARDDHEGRASWAVKPRVDHGYGGDPPDEYWLVDKIVAPHRRDKDDFWELVSRFYLGEMDQHLIAREFKPQKPVWWVESMLQWCCEVVRREYEDWR